MTPSKFQVGDVCVPNSSQAHICGSYDKYLGDYVILTQISSTNLNHRYDIYNKRGEKLNWCSCFGDSELMLKARRNKNKTFMSKISLMMKKLLSADVQKQVKVGYINGDLELTDKGTKALLTVLYTEKTAELTQMADEEIAEEEKSKN